VVGFCGHGNEPLGLIKCSRTTSRVSWLKGENTNVSRTLYPCPQGADVSGEPVCHGLVLQTHQHPEDEDRDSL
jgi:hypothetical protein